AEDRFRYLRGLSRRQADRAQPARVRAAQVLRSPPEPGLRARAAPRPGVGPGYLRRAAHDRRAHPAAPPPHRARRFRAGADRHRARRRLQVRRAPARSVTLDANRALALRSLPELKEVAAFLAPAAVAWIVMAAIGIESARAALVAVGAAVISAALL